MQSFCAERATLPPKHLGELSPAGCDASWRTSPGDQCGSSPCDFCCTDEEMQGSGGICPVITCNDALRSIGMDDIWPMGDNHEECVSWLECRIYMGRLKLPARRSVACPHIGWIDMCQETLLYNLMALLILMVFFRLQGLNILMMSYRYATTGRCLPCSLSWRKPSEVSV